MDIYFDYIALSIAVQTASNPRSQGEDTVSKADLKKYKTGVRKHGHRY